MYHQCRIDQPHSPDLLKPLDAVCSPDPRQKQLVVFTHEKPGYREKTLEDQYSAVSAITLGVHVPEDVRICFETARNLLLYSWFVYRFIPVAELQGFASLEYALRIRALEAKRKAKNLKQLLRLALNLGWLTDEALKEVSNRFVADSEVNQPQAPPGKGADYVSFLATLLPDLRNERAHGSRTLDPVGFRTLRLCAGLINHLFK